MTDNEIATNHKLPEAPTSTHDELLLWHALHRLEVAYWYDVDVNEGRTAHEFLCSIDRRTLRDRAGYSHFLWWSIEATIKSPYGGRFDQ